MGLFHKLFHSGKLREPLDFAPIGVDMHSHLIPGIDDGVQSTEESLEMIRGLKELGFRKLITTPHVMNDTYPNTTEGILQGIENVRKALERAQISNMEVEAAAEYLLDDGFPDKLKSGNLLTIGENYLLVEMSYVFEPVNLNQLIFDIQTAGYRLIMAHAERYGFWSQKKQRYQEMKDRSVLLQLNLLSLTGYYGKEVQKTAMWLLENDMYDVAGTDLHNVNYLRGLHELSQMQVVEELLKKSESFLNHKL
jgi:tyrosine-protein phosphatase YwqE